MTIERYTVHIESQVQGTKKSDALKIIKRIIVLNKRTRSSAGILRLLIRGPGIRVPSSAPKSHEESQDSSWDFLLGSLSERQPPAPLVE